MATKREAKIKFTADTGEFNENIAKANSTMSKLRSELKLNSTEMKANGESVELLTQRQEILAQEANASQAKIENLTAKLNKAKEIFGENSVEADRLATQLNNAKAAEVKIQAEIQQTNAKLQKAETEMKQAENAAREMAGGLDKAKREADDLGSSIADIAAGNMIADFASGAIDSLAGLEEATRQYRSEQAKLVSIAETSGQSVDALKEQYQDLYAITADETLSSTAVANMSAMGLSTEQSSELVHAATGIWAQYGDSIPLDGLMESVNETAAVGTVTGNLADALNWAKISEDEFNEQLAACSTEQERQQLIIDTLNGQYGTLADSYLENNAAAMDANRAAAELLESQAKLSEQVAPLQTAMTSLAADGLGFLAENFRIIAPIVTAAGVSFGILAVAMNFSAIVQGLSTAMGVLNAVMALNPAVLVVAGLVLLVTTFVTLWTQCESFRNFWIDLWDGLKATAQKGAEFFSWVGSTISSKISAVGSAVSSTFSNIYTAITSKISAARDFVGDAIEKIKSFFKFEWSLPQIKLPHFSVSGGKAPWGFAGQGSLPKVSVQWYAKAMDKAMVLTRPTIFGYGNGSLLGGGEAGNEVVAGEGHLVGLISDAVERVVSNVANHNEVHVTVNAQGDADTIANAVAYKVFGAIDQAMTANGR